jgi:hypothetical protein
LRLKKHFNMTTHKPLVIHPKDYSTTFLKRIYDPLEKLTLVTGGFTKSGINRVIGEHSRVFLLGHGSPAGLMSVGQFRVDSPYVIDDTHANLFSVQSDNLYIWCNADLYVKRHGLRGVYSGMFISEVSEAVACGLKGISQRQVTESNNCFGDIMGECIHMNKTEMYDTLMKSYERLARVNPVARYNHDRLYLS